MKFKRQFKLRSDEFQLTQKFTLAVIFRSTRVKLFEFDDYTTALTKLQKYMKAKNVQYIEYGTFRQNKKGIVKRYVVYTNYDGEGMQKRSRGVTVWDSQSKKHVYKNSHIVA